TRRTVAGETHSEDSTVRTAWGRGGRFGWLTPLELHSAALRPKPCTPTRGVTVSAQITVTVAGSERTVDQGTTAADLFADDRQVVVARVGGELRDLAHELLDGEIVEPVLISEPDGLDVLRHSCAHVLAQAVQEVNPEAKLGIGPPIRDGFYYDFDVAEPFTPEDLKQLEKV